MEYVIVAFPTSRLVYIDDEESGYTNEVLRIAAGTHVFELGNLQNYRPASRSGTCIWRAGGVARYHGPVARAGACAAGRGGCDFRHLRRQFYRRDLAAEFYDREVFGGATYRDIIARNRRPFVILNATDMTTGAQCALNLPSAHKVDFYPIQVAFDYIVAPEERAWFRNLPTTFELPRETIDKLRAVGRRLLSEDPQFQKLLEDLDGSSPP